MWNKNTSTKGIPQLRPPSRRVSWRSAFAIACCICVNTVVAAPAPRVLVLNSWHQGYEWTDDIVAGIQSTLQEVVPDAELHIEYMDRRRHAGSQSYDDLLAGLYAQKYAGMRFDAIIATDDQAVRFLIEKRTRLFVDTPVVFCGVNEYRGASEYVRNASVRQFATGVLETIDVIDTARIALKLHPDTKFIYLIGDPEDQHYEQELSREFPDVTVRRIRNEQLPMEEIERQLTSLPQASIVLLSAFSRDGTQRQFSMAASTRIVTERSVAPVYGFNKNSLGSGIVGGKVTDGVSQGAAVARLVGLILRGKQPAEIPITAESTNPYMFDYAQLQRWGVRQSSLPAGSRVVGGPVSMYQQYKSAIWWVGVFIAGQAVAIALLLLNRARRKRVEQALRDKEEDLGRQVRDFETLLNVLPVGIGIAEDRDCRSIRINPAFANLLGISVDQNSSRTPPDSEPLPFRVYRNSEEVPASELPMQVAARQGREVRDFELDFVRSDGRTIHEYGHATPLRDENGNVRGCIGVFVDITERKESEEALRHSESRFRQLADSMPQIVWTAQPDGYLDYYNRRWYEFTGLPEGEGGDQSWTPILHPDDLDKCLESWYSCVRSGDPYEIEYRFWHASTRRYRWQLGRALPVRDGAGRISKWFGTCTDIEDRKQTEEALRRANADLQQFAYSASHDLQEPLRNVGIYSQLVSKRYAATLDADSQQFLGYIVEGAHRMESLLKGLLAYTQIAAVPVEPAEPVSPNIVLTDLLEELNGHIQASRASITIEGELPSVRMHRTDVAQLFRNLVVNALTYRRPEPCIHISAEQQRSHHLFSVRDNGIGIPPEYSHQIFGIFKRLHTRERYQGAGIGLAICQKIVERYGGKIWVDSTPGNGATFRFTVPLQRSQHHVASISLS